MPRPDLEGKEKGPYTIADLETSDQRRRFNHFLPIQISKHKCAALIDSGDQLQNVISNSFATRLGIMNIKPIQLQPKVMTAPNHVTILVEALSNLQLTIPAHW